MSEAGTSGDDIIHHQCVITDKKNLDHLKLILNNFDMLSGDLVIKWSAMNIELTGMNPANSFALVYELDVSFFRDLGGCEIFFSVPVKSLKLAFKHLNDIEEMSWGLSKNVNTFSMAITNTFKNGIKKVFNISFEECQLVEFNITRNIEPNIIVLQCTELATCLDSVRSPEVTLIVDANNPKYGEIASHHQIIGKGNKSDPLKSRIYIELEDTPPNNIANSVEIKFNAQILRKLLGNMHSDSLILRFTIPGHELIIENYFEGESPSVTMKIYLSTLQEGVK